MELQTFAVKSRTTKGKGQAGRDRHAGIVPGVVYGAGKDNINISVGAKELEYLLHHGQGEHAMVDLSCADNSDANGPAMVKAVQHHPVRGNALHFDLIRIDLKKTITTLVPVKMEGQSVGIVAGGVLDYHMREVEVECLPLDVPEFIIGDITNMDVGDTMHISDLITIDNVTILTDTTRTVAAVHTPRVVTDEVAETDEGVASEEETTEEAAE
jgi:large subunit ribosomal protein L25